MEMIVKNFIISSCQLQADKVMAREEKCIAHCEEFMKEQQKKRAEVDEEHRKAMERLKEQYSDMEKELAKYVSFWDLFNNAGFVPCSVASDLNRGYFGKLKLIKKRRISSTGLVWEEKVCILST